MKLEEKMLRRKTKDKLIEVSYEYERTIDAEERLNKIFEFLLSQESKCQKNASLE